MENKYSKFDTLSKYLDKFFKMCYSLKVVIWIGKLNTEKELFGFPEIIGKSIAYFLEYKELMLSIGASIWIYEWVISQKQSIFIIANTFEDFKFQFYYLLVWLLIFRIFVLYNISTMKQYAYLCIELFALIIGSYLFPKAVIVFWVFIPVLPITIVMLVLNSLSLDFLWKPFKMVFCSGKKVLKTWVYVYLLIFLIVCLGQTFWGIPKILYGFIPLLSFSFIQNYEQQKYTK